jgi:hypothetical protein
MQSYRVGDMVTFMLPDGIQAHGKVDSISDKKVRIAWEVPKVVKICHDTASAQRAFEQVRV